MKRYIALLNFTDQGIAHIADSPRRAEEFCAQAEAAGIKIRALYWTQGEFDGVLAFEAPDEERFPPLRLAREAMEAGGMAPCILNAAHEIALDGFIAGQIGFLDMASLVNDTISALGSGNQATSLEDVFEADAQARRTARELIAQR